MIATLLVFVVLFGSDLLIGGTGHYVGSNADNIWEYLSLQSTWIELAKVFVISVIIVTFIRYGLPYLGFPRW